VIIACDQCGFGVSNQGLVCPKCNAPTPIAKARAATRRRNVVLSVLVVAALVGFFGTYRIVSGVPGLLVRRSALGFDDVIASVDGCTVSPRNPVVDTNRPLCRDLERAGVLFTVVPAGGPRQ
jgi:hypothetical protein